MGNIRWQYKISGFIQNNEGAVYCFVSLFLYLFILLLDSLLLNQKIHETFLFGAQAYGNTLGLFSTLLGFIITAYSIILTIIRRPEGNIFKYDKKSEANFHNCWKRTIAILAYSSFFSLLGLLKIDMPNIISSIFSGCFLLLIILSCINLQSSLLVFFEIIDTPSDPSPVGD